MRLAALLCSERRTLFAHQFRQLGEIDRHAPSLVFSQALVDRSPGWFVVEIEKPERLAVGVRDAECLGKFLDSTKAAGSDGRALRWPDVRQRRPSHFTGSTVMGFTPFFCGF